MQSRLSKIEKRLLEIDEEKEFGVYNYGENLTGNFDDEIEKSRILHFDIEKNKLQMERQFILDGRNGWWFRIVWDMVVPIIITLITIFCYLKFGIK
ncbi:MAG: hypothetical protein WC518_04195 [Patescibacteria group bacterium]